MSIEQFRSRLPPQLRWRVDADYLEKLSPADRAWYLQYLDEEYRACFPPDEEPILPKKARREAQNYVRSQKADRRPDLMNFGEGAPGTRVPLDRVSEGALHDAMSHEDDEDDPT